MTSARFPTSSQNFDNLRDTGTFLDDKEEKTSQINPRIINEADLADHVAFVALAKKIGVTVTLADQSYIDLSTKEKDDFHLFLTHCENAQTGLSGDLVNNQENVKSELKLAHSAYRKLNSRPVAAACFAVLAAVAAAAAAVFLWPAAVVASLGITAMHIGIGAAALSVTSAVISGLFAGGIFKNKKFDDLKAVEDKLEEISHPTSPGL